MSLGVLSDKRRKQCKNDITVNELLQFNSREYLKASKQVYLSIDVDQDSRDPSGN